MLRVRAQPGQALITEGEASDWMMILLRGTVDVGKRKIGSEADRQRARRQHAAGGAAGRAR